MNLRIKKTARLALGLLAGWAAMGGATARADTIIVSLVQVTGSDPFTFTYHASISGLNRQVNPGDYFRIFDFGGYLGGAFFSSGWSFCDNCAILPGEMVTVDAPDVPNLLFTYIGSSPIFSGATIFNPGNSASLGMFGATSSYSGMQLGTYTFQDFNSQLNQSMHGMDGIAVPAPEPASLLLTGAGLVVLALRRRR